MGHSLRSLPRATASPAFNSEVLRKVRKASVPERSVAFIWRMAAGVAMAASLLGAISLGSMQYVRNRHVAELRAEQQKLQAELQAVKQIASEPEPAVIFENSDGTQVIVDLDSTVQPASHRSFD
jgi:hypothetical protein